MSNITEIKTVSAIIQESMRKKYKLFQSRQFIHIHSVPVQSHTV